MTAVHLGGVNAPQFADETDVLDRVWLAKRGLYLGGGLYFRDGFERVAWTDDGRAFERTALSMAAADSRPNRFCVWQTIG
jgi:hypothetical protein